MARAGVVFADVEAETQRFEAQVAAAARRAGEAAGRVTGDQFTKSFSDKLARQGAQLDRLGRDLSRKVTLPLAAGFGFAIKAASDLNESVSKTEQVFGDAAGEVKAFADTAAKSIGQSRRSALDAASGFGTLFKSIGLADAQSAAMSLQFTKLASDLASFKNTSPEEAIQALSSALVGEAEPIRRYGVLLDDASLKQAALSQGLGDYTKGTLPPAIRAQAAYGLILEQTKTQQGNFALTAKDMANQTRTSKAELEDAAAKIGTTLLPAAAQLTKQIGEAATAFGRLPQPVQTGTLALAGLAVAAGPVLTVAGNLEKAAAKLGPQFKSMGVVGAAQFAIVGAAAAVAAQQLADADAKARALVETLTKNLKTNDLESFAAAEAALAAKGEELNRSLEDANKNGLAKFGATIAAVGQVLIPFTENTLVNHAEQLDAVKRAYDEVNDRGVHLRANVAEIAKDFGLTTEDVLRLAESAHVDLTQGFGDASAAFGEAYDKQQSLKTATTDLGKTQEILGSQVATAKEKIEAFSNALDASLASTVGVDHARRSVAEAEERLNALRARGAVDAEKVAAAERDVASAARSVADARRALVDAEAELARLRAGPTADEAGDAERAVRHADLSVKRAQQRLEEARKAARHAAKGREQEEAALALQEAELGLADAIDAANGARKEQADLNARGKAGSRELEDAERRVADAKEAQKTALDEQKRAEADVRAARAGDPSFNRDLADALDAVVEAQRKEVESLATAGSVEATAAAQGKALYDRLVELEKKFPDLTGVVDDYLEALGKIPGVTVPGASIPEFNAGNGVRFRAAGGPVQAGMPYIVGERRPELFVPRQDGYVHPEVPRSAPTVHLTVQSTGGGLVADAEYAARVVGWRLADDGRP